MRPLYSFRNKILLLVLLAAAIPVADLVILHYGFSKRLERRISEDFLRVQREERRRVEKTARRIMEVFVRQKAMDVANRLDLYLMENRKGIEELRKDPAFRRLALQPVGKDGYTAVINSSKGTIYFHPWRKIEGTTLTDLSDRLPALRALFLAQKEGHYVGGYYHWIDPDGRMREKYLYFAPLEVRTADGVKMSVAATAYVEEFLTPLRASQDVLHISPYLADLFRREFRNFHLWSYGIFFPLFGLVLLIALSIGNRISRSVTRLKEAMDEVVEKGKLDTQIPTRSFDEMGVLFRTFNMMVSALHRSTVTMREWENTFNAVTDPIVLIDREYRILRCNRAVESFVGKSQERIQGDKCYRILWEEEEPCKGCPLLGGGRIIVPSFDERTFRGRELYVSHFPTFDERGRVEGVAIILRDITPLKERERTLKEEKERFQALIEHSPLAIALVGRDGRYLYLNPKFTEFFGYTLEEIPTGKEWFEKAFPDPELRKKVIRAWVEDTKEAAPLDEKVRVYPVHCKDGSVKETRFVTLVLPDGRYLVMYEDITERQRLERELLQAQKMEAVGILAGGIAHDFNNLLTTIKGFAQILLLQMREGDFGYRELKQIEKAADWGAELSRQLLTFSRRVPSETKVLDLNEQIEQISYILSRTLPKMIEVELKLSPHLWPIQADPARIEQVIMNLAVNARDAMPEGGKLTIETKNVTIGRAQRRNRPEIPLGKYVLLRVSDTGCGMTEEVRRRIFEPFFTTKGMGRGTGLGLSIVYGIVKDHKGYINCRSEVGRGTTFEIFWPALQEDTKGGKTEDRPRGG